MWSDGSKDFKDEILFDMIEIWKLTYLNIINNLKLITQIPKHLKV